MDADLLKTQSVEQKIKAFLKFDSSYLNTNESDLEAVLERSDFVLGASAMLDLLTRLACSLGLPSMDVSSFFCQKEAC